jgi:hypothetical protein
VGIPGGELSTVGVVHVVSRRGWVGVVGVVSGCSFVGAGSSFEAGVVGWGS